MDNDILFRLINTANFLDIPSLLDLLCAKVRICGADWVLRTVFFLFFTPACSHDRALYRTQMATLIKGKTPDELRAIFHITGEYTPQDEADTLDANPWLREM